MAGYATNSRVTKLGKLQIQHAARRLAKENYDIIYSSDLIRCRHLAMAVKKLSPHLKIIYAKELRERHFGIYEGKKRDLYVKIENAAKNVENYCPPGGESRNTAAKRMHKFLSAIEHKHKHVLIVTHGGIKRIFLNTILNLNITASNNYNTGISLVDYTQRKVIYYFDVSHLPKDMHT
jgi:broad specificity phosphatase PhoE